MDKSYASNSRSPLWRALQQLRKDAGCYRENLLDALNGELCELRDTWRIDTRWTSEAVKANVLARARNRINTELIFHIGQLKHPGDVSREKYIHAIYAEFNLPTKLIKADLSKRDLTRRRRWLEREAPVALRVSPSTSYRYLIDAITQFEQQILAAGSQPASEDRSSLSSEYFQISEQLGEQVFASCEAFSAWWGETFGFDGAQEYIPRQEYEEQFARLIARGEQVVVFTGEPGVGKSWLANFLTAREAGERSKALIRMSGGKVYMPDIQAAYTAFRIDTSNLIGSGPEELFANLICSPNVPEFIVLDGLFSSDELLTLPLAESRATIVATCRIEGSRPIKRAGAIRVTSMTVEESTMMILTRVASGDFNDVVKLAAMLQGHPLAIAYACELIKHGGATVPSLVSDIAEGLAYVNNRAIAGGGRPLYAAIRSVISHLVEINKRAFTLMLFIAVCKDIPWIDYKVLKHWHSRHLYQVISEMKESERSLAYADDIKLLADLNLVHLDGRTVSMSPFVRETIVQTPLAPSILEFFAEITQLFMHDYAAAAYEVGDEVLCMAIACATNVFSEFLSLLKQNDGNSFGAKAEIVAAAESFCRGYLPQFRDMLLRYQALVDVPPVYFIKEFRVAEELTYLLDTPAIEEA